MVDVGGGTGLTARTISEAFPQLKCTVFDLPHVVANLPEYRNLEFVGGDMFQSVPSADATLMKLFISRSPCLNADLFFSSSFFFSVMPFQIRSNQENEQLCFLISDEKKKIKNE